MLIKIKKISLLCVLVFFVWFSGFGQRIDQELVSGSFHRQTISQILRSIEKKSRFSFYFKDEWFDQDTITIEVNAVSLQSAIGELMKNIPYAYTLFQDDMIIFLPKEKLAFVTGEMSDNSLKDKDYNTFVVGDQMDIGKYKEVEITGQILDGKTGAPLIGATIGIENTNIGTSSNHSGYYNIMLQPGIYSLTVSSIGFNPEKLNVKVLGPGSLDIELFEKTLDIEEVAIYAQKADKNLRVNQMSLVEMDTKSIKQLPNLIGEKDVMKGLTMMPGVKSIGEFGSGINVRGGGEDQNLYLVEGAPLFNTSHVFGLLSVINPDAVNKLTLYKGHIPANYGERVSSVLDIELKNNIEDKLHSRGGIGLYNSRLSVEGPLLNNKISFKAGGRSSYSDWLLGRIQDYYLQNSSARFYDFNGLINLNFKKDKITLFGYQSNDRFSYANELTYEYGNTLGSFKWTHLFNQDFSSSLLTSYSSYEVFYDDIKSIFEQSRINSGVQYLSGKIDFYYTGLTSHKLSAGGQLISYEINPGLRTALTTESMIQPLSLQKEHSYESAVYLNDLYEIGNSLSLNAGVRFSYYNHTGPLRKPVYQSNAPVSPVSVIDSVSYGSGDIIASYKGIEPRFSVRYQFAGNKSLKLSYSRSNQYIALISYTSIPTPEDVWKLSDKYLKPITADHYALGFYNNFLENTLETSVELYYKNLLNVLEYKNDAQLLMNQHIETEVLNAEGKNYGAEFMIRKNSGKTEGWVSYTYSRSFTKTQGVFPEEIISDNQWYPSGYDKPHDLKIVVTHHINRRWRVSGNFSFMSGRAVTLPEYEFRAGREMIIYYSDRNKYRLPPYHRLDLSISLNESLRIKKKWKGSWTFSILNLYGRKNAYSVFYKKETPDITNNYKRFSLYKLYIIGRPLPTLTYNFIF